MAPRIGREVRLAARPRGWPKESDFELVETQVPAPGPGEALVETLYMSVDPYMRGRMNDVRSYTPPFELGEALSGGAVGRVLESRSPDLAEGELVQGMFGWRERCIAPAATLQKLPPGPGPTSAYLGTLGMPGLTAYVGLLDIGQPKPGETVYISAAAGAVGNVAGQIARIVGCRVVGSAGSDAKVEVLTKELGFDAAFNYKNGDLDALLSKHCPDGIDIYFENVGGAHLRAVLNHMKPFGRIPVCGMISLYNDEKPEPGPDNLTLIIVQRLKLQGYIISDSYARLPEYLREASQWIAEGKLVLRETIVEGIENAVPAFLGLMRGENIGKMLVKLADET